jgi:hypothetical protein
MYIDDAGAVGKAANLFAKRNDGLPAAELGLNANHRLDKPPYLPTSRIAAHVSLNDEGGVVLGASCSR